MRSPPAGLHAGEGESEEEDSESKRRHDGNAEDYLPSVVSSGNELHVRFITDTHNCGIDSSEDPGWIADWDFIENGQDICHPDAAVLRDPHGTLHDDAPGGAVNCQNGGCGSGTGGGAANG